MIATQRRYVATIVVFGIASLVIVLLSAIRTADRITYDLPALSKVTQAGVDEIVIERPAGTVALVRAGDHWVVEPGGYRAHQPSVSYLLALPFTHTLGGARFGHL